MARLFDPVNPVVYTGQWAIENIARTFKRRKSGAAAVGVTQPHAANQLVSGMSSYNRVRLYHVWLQIQVMSLSKSTHSYVTPHFYFVLFETLNFIFKLNVA